MYVCMCMCVCVCVSPSSLSGFHGISSWGGLRLSVSVVGLEGRVCERDGDYKCVLYDVDAWWDVGYASYAGCVGCVGCVWRGLNLSARRFDDETAWPSG